MDCQIKSRAQIAEEGALAASRGITLGENPYPKQSHAHVIWADAHVRTPSLAVA